jgi:hypothetical protein
MDEHIFDEYKNLIDQLNAEARRDVLDMSVFLVWKQTHNPAPWRNILRGGWLWVAWKVKGFMCVNGKPSPPPS